ncbi:MAG: lipid-A-disaccharide synthase, partial [Terriglobia bacterium]
MPTRKPIPLMIVAGERSGDIYGALLAAALKTRLPDLEVFGCGGEAMRSAGAETVVDLREFAMVGITEVISGLPGAYRALRSLVRAAEHRRPRLAVLIDSPSLNMRLARRLKRRSIPVIYFVSPQV